MLPLILHNFSGPVTCKQPRRRTCQSSSTLLCSDEFGALLQALIAAPALSEELGREFAQADAVTAISACRMLRSVLNLPLGQGFRLMAELFAPFADAEQWQVLADKLGREPQLRDVKLITYLTQRVNDEAVRQRC